MSKVFKDPVHGEIELDPLCVKIVDTPEFQRLRFIRQLGACFFLYHGASHSRFDHSIGVYHLAGKLVEAIASGQEDDQKVSEKKRLCVKIAGLCHDLGHGPFSHMFEKVVKKLSGKKWKHEEASKNLIDRIYGKLKDEFKELGNLDEGDVAFIKELIHPPKDKYKMVRKGTDKEKKDFFLYEIVANKTYGVDVDKWDYFARDSLYLGVKNSFDHDRLIASARACLDENGVSHVTYRDKDVDTLYEMFHIRFTLHRKAYKHRVTKAVEMMIGDAMELADDVKVKGDDGNEKRIHEAVDDMGAYIKLNDDVLHRIAESSNEAASKLVARIYERKLYKYLDEKTITKDMKEQDVIKEIPGKENKGKDMQDELGDDNDMKEQDVVKEILGKENEEKELQNNLGVDNDMKEQDVVKEILGTENEEKGLQKNLGVDNDMKEQDVVKEILGTEYKEKELQNLGVDIASYDYGNKDKNPVLNAYIYTKDDNETAIQLEERALGRRMMVPMQFNERVARAFCKDPECEKTLKEKTEEWLKIKNKATNA